MTISRTTGLGHPYEAWTKHNQPLPEPKPDRHEWIVVAMFRVANPARSQHLLDMENLVTVDGPGCLHCEQVWTPTIGARCPGDPAPGSAT